MKTNKILTLVLIIVGVISFVFVSKVQAVTYSPQIIKDIHPRLGSHPDYLTSYNGLVYFLATDSGEMGEGCSPEEGGQLCNLSLWKSDGTTDGTTLVKNFGDVDSGGLVVSGGFLFFKTSDDTITTLWKSDGTESGTVEIKVWSDGSYIDYITSTGSGNIYFMFSNYPSYQLWKSDGTTEGTVAVKETGFGESGFNNFSYCNGLLFFSTDRSGSNYDTLLWKSDGTSEGTTYVKKINESGQDNVSSYGLVCKNNTVFFSAYEPEHGQELWKSDGTLEGTVILKDIKTGTESGYPTNFVVFNDSIIFSANTSEHGQELWKSDGTTEGTVMIKDIYPGDNGSFPYSSSPNYIINTGDIFYFVANSADNGEELWKSDGTTEGTVMVKDVYPGYESGVYYLLSGGVIGDKFYFPANDNISGYELWQTDGTTANTTMVADIYTGSEGSHPSSFFNLNGQLIFVVNDGVYDYELWGISPDANYYTLSYFAGDGGTLTGSTTQSVLEGESGTDVTAVASSGYRFVRWSDNSTSNPRVDNNVSTDISVSAIFEIVNSKRSYGSYMPGYGPMINNSSENLVVASTEKTMPVNFTRNLKLKMRGIDVKDLQSYLNSKMNLNLKIDGIFGNLTRQAVIKFQIANNLVGDGIVGPLTRAKLK